MNWWQQLIAGSLTGIAIAGAVVYGVIQLTDYLMELVP